MKPPRPFERLRAALSNDAVWWQLPLFLTLLAGGGLFLLLWSRDRTEFIYALF
jgi:hypothetical protein